VALDAVAATLLFGKRLGRADGDKKGGSARILYLFGAAAMSSNRRALPLATSVALGLTSISVTPLICYAAEPARELDGLVRVDSRQLDHLYVLPGADFSSYKRVKIDPVDVSFSETWDPNANRSPARRSLSDRDIENIKSSVATEFHRVFSDELTRNGYDVVEETGPDVLRVTPMIVNLYVAAPSAQQAPRSRIYVANTGRMTLVAVVRDSVSGEFLARAIDTQHGRSTGRMQLASGVANMADARRAFRDWARVLRSGLDDARKNPVANEGLKEAAKQGEEGTPR
jgi:hypothetical protein